MFIKAIAATTLALLVASTSLASAGGIKIIKLETRPEVVLEPSKPIIIIDPSNPKPIDLPFEPLGPAKPVKPFIPIVNADGDTIVPIGGFPKAPTAGTLDEVVLLDCVVPGVEFAETNDLLIKNVGSVDLPVGLKLKFRVRSTGDHGAFVLPSSVRPGKHLLIAGLLHGATAGAPCDAQIL